MTVGRLFILFFAFAVLEVFVMSVMANLIGWPLTLVLLVATGVIGSALFRRQGASTWSRLNQRIQAGEMPGRELVEGAMLLIGSVCLITPGFITDAFGFLLLIPHTRRSLANWMIDRGRVQAFTSFNGPFGQSGFGATGFYADGGNVYEGEATVRPESTRDRAGRRIIEISNQNHGDTYGG